MNSRERKNILICGNFVFPKPNGNAPGNLVYGFGLILRELGYKVTYCGVSINKQDILNTHVTFDGFDIYEMNQSLNNSDWLNVNKAYDDCKKVIENIGLDSIKAIIIYGSPVLGFWIYKINKFAHCHNIKTVYYSVDWIEKTNGGFLRNVLKYADTNYKIRIVGIKTDGVIAISKYIEKFYLRRKQNVFRLPPISKFQPKNNHEISEIFRFIYSGNSYDKNIKKAHPKNENERLDLAVEIIDGLINDGVNCRFDIYGLDFETYVKYYPKHIALLRKYEKLTQLIQFHGRVGKNDITTALIKADALFFCRNVTKATMAGFPSRVAESLCLGTPVFTTNTSDLADYITTGENGIIIDNNVDIAKEQIKNVLCDHKRLQRMLECTSKACVFDYRNYFDSTKAFIESL